MTVNDEAIENAEEYLQDALDALTNYSEELSAADGPLVYPDQLAASQSVRDDVQELLDSTQIRREKGPDAALSDRVSELIDRASTKTSD